MNPDRGPLGVWSLDVDDDAWPAALAALGVLAALPPAEGRAAMDGAALAGPADASGAERSPNVVDAASEALGAVWDRALQAARPGRQPSVLEWKLPAIDLQGGVSWRASTAGSGPVGHCPVPDALLLATAWRRWLSRRGAPAGPRLRVRLPVPARLVGASLDLVPVLAATASGAAAVFVDDPRFAADGRTAWQWPFTIATLPGQPLAALLTERQQALPPQWPFRLVEASRDTPHVELLVIAAPAAEALVQWLRSGLRLQACMVVVAGLGDDSSAQALPLLHALAARVGAEGVAAIAPREAAPQGWRTWAEGLFAAGEALAHNLPLDIALAQGLGPGLVLMGRDLPQISSLSDQLKGLTRRLKALPTVTVVPLSETAAKHLRVPPDLWQAVEKVETLPWLRDEGIMAKSAGGLGGGGGGGGGPRPRPDRPRAAGASGGAMPPLPPTTRGVGASALGRAIREAMPDFRFDGERHEASATAELSRRVRRQEAKKAAEIPRFVHQRSTSRRDGRLVLMTHGYLRGVRVMVQVDIGPKRADGGSADVVFPDKLLPPDVDRHELQLVLYEPRQMDAPLQALIELPAKGRSSPGRFVFTPRASGGFAARLSVLHRGRVLQTLTLRSWVAETDEELAGRHEPISLREEAWVRHDWSRLDKRRRFDLALVFNHDAEDRPRATGIAERCAWATDLSALQKPVGEINDAISGVAQRVLDHADGLDQGENPALLRSLARAGVRLYGDLYGDQLAKHHSGGLDVGSDAVQCIQVVSLRADEVVPIEFIYDFDCPDDDSTVCPQHRQALAEGRCPPNCARQQAPEAHVCPMGFWGLKKEIERHQFNHRVSAPAGYPLVVQAEPAGDRAHLELARGLIVGHSDQVQRPPVAEMAARLGRLLEHEVTVVDDWKAWRAAVGTARPGMLLAFPHNEVSGDEARLEIGGKLLDTLRLKPDYVRVPVGPQQPLVLLLGCDTAGTAEQYANHVSWFRRAGAAVVVGTVATVFGEHAVKVGEAISLALLSPDARSRRIAEVIRDAKRQALLDSLPMALCVVAFGDADWQL